MDKFYKNATAFRPEKNVIHNTIYTTIRELIRKFRLYWRADFFVDFVKVRDGAACEAHARQYFLNLHPDGEKAYQD